MPTYGDHGAVAVLAAYQAAARLVGAAKLQKAGVGIVRPNFMTA